MIILLKDKSSAYLEGLAHSGHTVHFVPVHDHVLVNQDKLSECLRAAHPAFVVTSQRAVDALKATGFTTKKPVYVVGPSTGKAVRELQQPPPDIRGESTGSGSALGTLIAAQMHKEQSSGSLLLLTGDKTTGAIPAILSEHGIPFEELQVYCTHLRDSLITDLHALVAEWGGSKGDDEIWLVFFSPSGIRAVLPVLGAYRHRVRLAVIGPTTRECLAAEYGLMPDAEANQPQPEALLTALQLSTTESSAPTQTRA